jgi:hypothetical protein
LFAGQPLQNIVYRPIATASNDGVEPFADCHADLGSCVGSRARGLNVNLDAGFSKHRSCGFDVLHAVLFSPARVWIVKEGGFAHEKRILYERALPSTPAIVLD